MRGVHRDRVAPACIPVCPAQDMQLCLGTQGCFGSEYGYGFGLGVAVGARSGEDLYCSTIVPLVPDTRYAGRVTCEEPKAGASDDVRDRGGAFGRYGTRLQYKPSRACFLWK